MYHYEIMNLSEEAVVAYLNLHHPDLNLQLQG
jgi:hypothetical protein